MSIPFSIVLMSLFLMIYHAPVKNVGEREITYTDYTEGRPLNVQNLVSDRGQQRRELCPLLRKATGYSFPVSITTRRLTFSTEAIKDSKFGLLQGKIGHYTFLNEGKC